MDDGSLLELFLKGDQRAITEARAAYGAYCMRVALNITGDRRDAEECFSDALYSAWNSIPSVRPKELRAYLARLTRNAALDVHDKRKAGKRGGGAAEVALSELGDIASRIGDPSGEAERNELVRAISEFVNALPAGKRRVFTLRYWWFEDIADIAQACSKSPNRIRVELHRLREALKKHLKERGFSV